MRVEVRTDREDGVDKALKKLKKKLFDDGRIKELNERRYFEKPSAVKRRKHKEAVQRNQRKMRMRTDEAIRRGMRRA